MKKALSLIEVLITIVIFGLLSLLLLNFTTNSMKEFQQEKACQQGDAECLNKFAKESYDYANRVLLVQSKGIFNTTKSKEYTLNLTPREIKSIASYSTPSTKRVIYQQITGLSCKLKYKLPSLFDAKTVPAVAIAKQPNKGYLAVFKGAEFWIKDCSYTDPVTGAAETFDLSNGKTCNVRDLETLDDDPLNIIELNSRYDKLECGTLRVSPPNVNFAEDVLSQMIGGAKTGEITLNNIGETDVIIPSPSAPLAPDERDIEPYTLYLADTAPAPLDSLIFTPQNDNTRFYIYGKPIND